MADTLPSNKVAATVAVYADEATMFSLVIEGIRLFEPLTCHCWSSQSCLLLSNTNYHRWNLHCAR
jgi:hypothetical protein